MSAARHWLQFRLRDLFALVTLLAILLAIGLPYLHKAREQARAEACRDTLRSIGVTLHSFADLDPRGRYCTGKSDYLDIGCPDTVGWMADVINTDPLLRGKLMCAANPTIGWEGVNDLYNGGTIASSPIAQLSVGFCGNHKWNNASAGTGPDFAGSLPGTPERASLVARATWGSGLNTNYTPSWFLTCSSPRITFDTCVAFEPMGYDTRILVDGPLGQLGFWKSSLSNGGLTRRLVEGSHRVTSAIPFLGDGAPADKLLFAMKYGQRLSSGHVDPLRSGTARHFAPVGSDIVAATNRGPIRWNSTTNCLEWLAGRDDVTDQIAAEHPWKGRTLRGDLDFLQDTRGWKAWHRIAGKDYCNLLMGDGSVIVVCDVNGDGLLNPGFPIPLGLTAEEYELLGYRDGTVELHPSAAFSGVFLQSFFKHPFE